MSKNELCWCGSGKKYKRCHMEFDEKIDAMDFDEFLQQEPPPHRVINNERDIEGIRKAAVINNGALDLMDELVKPGIDTLTLNDAAHEFIVEHGGHPSCLHYEGFPKSICISVNEVVCHGIPSRDTILREGDIVNVDITTDLHGYFADASRMYIVGGKTSPEAEKLVRVTRECMMLGIEAAQPWKFVGDIGAVCAKHAHKNGFSVVTALGGHGVGKKFHLEPFVSHESHANTGMLLVPGMTITVEPMINQGGKKVTVDPIDHWTVRTADKKLSAQWEHTILITENGNEVISK
ncbi:MAG: type I methionyl aminopeptidase [Selenomonadaceae bacterium]|nr:type I methionyl aminopeptidase [Selenomonadaceae bacterium]